MSHCFPISSTIDFNRVNFPMCFEMGKQSPIHIHKHNWYISFFDLKICGVNKWHFQISQNVRSCYAQKPKVDNFPISCTSHVLLVCLRSLDVIPHLLPVVVSGFARTLKVLEFQNKNSRPWKSLKIVVGAGKSLNFGANFIQYRFSRF